MDGHRNREPRPDRGGHHDAEHHRPAGDGPSEDLLELSEAEERDLHFHGHPPYNLQPLHQLCYVGGCRYLSDAENQADLDDWDTFERLTAQGNPQAEL